MKIKTVTKSITIFSIYIQLYVFFLTDNGKYVGSLSCYGAGKWYKRNDLNDNADKTPFTQF